MKTNLFKLLCLLLTFSILFGCKPKTAEKTGPSTTTTSPKPEQPKPEQPKPEPPAPTPTSNNSDPVTSSTPVPTPPPLPPITKRCGVDNFDIAGVTNKAAKELEGIMYNREPSAKADCSGIYHRVVEKFKAICPDAKTPAFNKARDSRSLAAWYKKNGDLKIIRNPEANADLIQPGVVMFYGYGKRRNHYDFQKMTMDTLTLRGTGINHIAIVTSVNRVDGDLISYELFHGRTDNKASATTKSYKVTSWDKTWPMYGNAFEPWLAVASSPLGN